MCHCFCPQFFFKLVEDGHIYSVTTSGELFIEFIINNIGWNLDSKTYLNINPSNHTYNIQNLFQS